MFLAQPSESAEHAFVTNERMIKLLIRHSDIAKTVTGVPNLHIVARPNVAKMLATCEREVAGDWSCMTLQLRPFAKAIHAVSMELCTSSSCLVHLP